MRRRLKVKTDLTEPVRLSVGKGKMKYWFRVFALAEEATGR